ncbi:MAG: adenine nucleotide alpha hydrolase family protein [Desulfohalobiaceae bacterium]|nr:adenine nucleotide alpha hydrolase family protein [Desulfohalobiaceae bacterium]
MNKNSHTLSRGAKCIRCRQQAEIHLPSHHANFCPDCFLLFFQRQVSRGLKKIPVDVSGPLMVAVSGGKDSLAVWQVLLDLGYTTKGVYVDLGLKDFSRASLECVADFARERNLQWERISLRREFGFSLLEIDRLLKGKTCASCGRLKRGLLNRTTARQGFQTLVTGHHLDDEAGRLLGNLLGNRQEHVRKQAPFLPSPHPKVPARIKPLYRVDVREIKAYNQLKHIRAVQGSCPLAKGATSPYFKEALSLLEQKMPGSKRSFLYAYSQESPGIEPDAHYGSCERCGEPAFGPLCSLCSLKNRVLQKTHSMTTASS